MAASTIGGLLNEERLRQGKPVSVIAKETKICPAILSLLESDQFDSIPGGYRRSFLRQYARALGLNESEILAAFTLQYYEPPVALPNPPARRPGRLVPGLACLALAVAACFGLYKAAEIWQPARKLANMARRSAPTAVASAAAAPLGSAAPAAGNAARMAPEPAPAAAPPAENPNGPIHAGFTATEPTWVSVTCDGNPSYTGTLTQADQRQFEAAGTIKVLVGNAGGLTISLNGRPLGPIGAHGEIQFLELTRNGAHKLPRRSGPPKNSASVPEA